MHAYLCVYTCICVCMFHGGAGLGVEEVVRRTAIGEGDTIIAFLGSEFAFACQGVSSPQH